MSTTEQPVGLDANIPAHAEALARLSALERSLLDRDPMMKNHLAEIHKQLISFEELTHLLSEEQIGIIMAAQQVHTNKVLVTSGSTTAGKKRAAKTSANFSIADL